jgi:hypothetical protein
MLDSSGEVMTITRHVGNPFVTGETPDGGTDLEFDINAIVAELNGSLANANFAADADINGSRLLNGKVGVAKLAANTIPYGKVAAAASIKHHLSRVDTFAMTKEQTTLIDIPGVEAAQLTPGSTNDMIMMDVAFYFSVSTKPADADFDVVLGWSIDGTEYNTIASRTTLPSIRNVPMYSTYAIAAPSAQSSVIKPMYRYGGEKTVTVNQVVFRCWILPGK